MMCQKCGGEFSPKVWQVHIKRCRADEVPDSADISMDNPYKDMELEAMREIAKDRGIDRYWVKGRTTLEADLLKD